MYTCNQRRRGWLVNRSCAGVWVAAAACLVFVQHARGEVIGTVASVSITVQELIDATPGSVTSDEDVLNATSSNLPLAATGSLISTDLSGTLVSMGEALSEFSDPTRLDQPNPEEFGIEVACYSNAAAESVAYRVSGLSDETRTIVFTADEIDFGNDGTQEIESRVFLSGAVILWSTEQGVDLSEMLGELSIRVSREDTGASLFSTTLTVTGTGAGGAAASSDGPIRFEEIGLDDLADEGVDAESLAVLERVEQAGTIMVILIPPQEHAYRYTVSANEPLDLKAELSAVVRNAPAGTGMAAVWGRPFQNLADFIEEGLPGVNGAALQQTLNAAVARRSIGLVSEDDPNPTGARRFCGAFGFELAGLVGLAFALALTRLGLLNRRR